MDKIIAIVGPTATGKSDLGVSLAKKINGEIISVDSRQVYKGMDIGTGKITKREMKGIPHYLLDLVSPKSKQLSVFDFKKLAEKKIGQILKKNKVPILVGGTGFWIDAIALNQEFPEVGPNPKLRKELSLKSTEQIFKILKSLDPQRAKTIDSKNRHRLIRAIEISKASKKIPKQNQKPRYQTLFIGLDTDKERLNAKILKRLEARIKKGLVNEVKKLHSKGLSWEKLESFGLEYRFTSLYLQKKISSEQFKELLYTAIKQYAKRQRTWFKRNKSIHWMDCSNKNRCIRDATALSKEFLVR